MKYFSILLLGAALVASVYGVPEAQVQRKNVTVNLNSNIEDHNRQTSPGRCYSHQFQCTNGQCISNTLLCNGRNDCRDGSDESRAICYNVSSATTESNNNNNNNNNKGNSNIGSGLSCTLGQFSCTSGECIRQTQVCDGYSDCSDGSDEEPDICPVGHQGGNNAQCRADQFRCNNGECIYAGYQCDGTVHCTDNSDEDWTLCHSQPSTRPPATQRPPVTQRPPATQRPPSGGNSGSWTQKLTPCQVPPQPAHGRWRLHRSLCDSNRECEAPANVQFMDPGSFLVYQCDVGFALSNNRDVLCGPGGKWVHQPTCEQIKCNDLSSSTTEAFCLWNNVAVSCEVPAPIGTSAQLNCRDGFVQEVTYHATFKNVTCQPDGKWDPKPIQCVKKPKKVKLVLEGDMIIQD